MTTSCRNETCLKVSCKNMNVSTSRFSSTKLYYSLSKIYKMSFNAKLKIAGKDGIDVLACDYALHRDVDAKGRPASGVYGGTINLSVESTDDTSIIESMV